MRLNNYTTKGPTNIKNFLESGSLEDCRQLIREIAINCCKYNDNLFADFGFSFKNKSDKPRTMVANEVARLTLEKIMKERKTTASKVISIEIGLQVYKDIKEEFSTPVSIEVNFILEL